MTVTAEGKTMKALMLYDTMAAEKRPLSFLENGRCSIYSCGPTTYDFAHIGHARAALLPDLIVRLLRRQGVQVKYARNVTDIDDKIIHRAAENGEDPMALSARFTEAYLADMRALRMLVPDVQPKVTTHIGQIVPMIEKLIGGGYAYARDGDVFYRVRRFSAYGRLSGRNVDDMQAGARVEVDSRKEDPCDFALWKAAKSGEPAWDSPWGRGRPGWHIECSAMAACHLGETFDIHTGGRDLLFPHHENELAQTQAVFGESSSARFWVHNGFVNFAGEKMSKSLGNFFTVREVLALYHPEVLRYMLMSVHYRSPLNFDVDVECPQCRAMLDAEAQSAGICASCGYRASPEELRKNVRFPGLEDADERLLYVYETLRGAAQVVERAGYAVDDGEVLPAIEGMGEAFLASMLDDLNTAGALAALSEPLKEANRLVQTGKGVNKQVRLRSLARFGEMMKDVARVLGVFERPPHDVLLERRTLKARRVNLDVSAVEALVRERETARRTKAWGRADEIRTRLSELGVSVQDGPEGSTWSL